MPALTLTLENVKLVSASRPKRVVYGETITQGQPVYQSSADSRYYRTDANDGIAKANCQGIAISPGVAGEFGSIAIPGRTPGESLINLGTTLAVGQVYVVGATVGTIAPYSDLTTGDWVTILGVAKTTALLDLQILVSDTQKA